MGKPNFVDELTPIASYMAGEMTTNVSGPDCRQMAELNAVSSQRCMDDYFHTPSWRRFVAISPQQCIEMEMTSGLAALMLWTSKVMQDAVWDHKPKLRRMFPSPTTKTSVWHTYDQTMYYYDIWSNIHYGYVGAAAGFSDAVLLDGAGLEQIGTDIIRKQWPKSSGVASGLRRFDDMSDREAIALGIDLFRISPAPVTAAALVRRILGNPRLQQKAAPQTLNVRAR
jgi:hypothetical protein